MPQLKRGEVFIVSGDTAKQITVGIGMGVFGWISALVHVGICDQMYLRKGGLQRIERFACRWSLL